MMPTAARVMAANAAVTVAGFAASCSVPSAARISRARAAILRCRPPRERQLRRARAQVGALLGVGARAQHPKASPWARSWEGHQGGRVVLAKRWRRALVSRACPDQVLVGAGENFDRLASGLSRRSGGGCAGR